MAEHHPDTPAEVLLTACMLADDPDPRVRRHIAANPALPASHITGLLADPDQYVVMAAASTPALPAALAHDLIGAARDHGLLPDDDSTDER
jgi:hypothetical protein